MFLCFTTDVSNHSSSSKFVCVSLLCVELSTFLTLLNFLIFITDSVIFAATVAVLYREIIVV